MNTQHFFAFLVSLLLLYPAAALADRPAPRAGAWTATADSPELGRPILGAELGVLWLEKETAGMAKEVMGQLGMTVRGASQAMQQVSPVLTQEWRVSQWFSVILREQLGFIKVGGSLAADPQVNYRLARHIVPIHAMAQLHLSLSPSTDATLAAGVGATYVYTEETGHFGQQSSHHLPWSAAVKLALWRQLVPIAAVGISYSASWTTLPMANPLWSDGGENRMDSLTAGARVQL